MIPLVKSSTPETESGDRQNAIKPPVILAFCTSASLVEPDSKVERLLAR